MKQILLIVLFTLSTNTAFSQQEVTLIYDNTDRLIKAEYFTLRTIFYYYDQNGNRIQSITSNKTICNGGKTYFHAGTIDTASTYQWQVNEGSGFVTVSNNAVYAGTGTHTILLTNPPTSWYGYIYRCQVSGPNGITYSQVDTLKFQSVWQGAVSTAWENPSNWSCGNIPDQYTDVVINAGTPFPPVINSNVFIGSLLANSGAKVTVNTAYSLKINK